MVLPYLGADKMASGTLPASKSAAAAAAAAPAGPSTASSPIAAKGPAGDEHLLDAGMVDGLAALLAVAVPACVPNARKKVGQHTCCTCSASITA